MRKLVLCLSLLCCFAMTVYAEGYSEDFSGYNYKEVYNSEALTVSLEGYSDAALKASNKYIINGPGGIVYGDSESYTANAAENIFCYTKTGEGTAMPVFGGLNNGWKGYYSHPQTSLDSKGGASAEMNQYNRRLAVVAVKGEPVLQLNPASTSSTYSVYADDDVEFYNNTKWSTDVYIANIGENSYQKISLTKGQINQIVPFTYVESFDNGRIIVADVVRFDNSKAYCFEEEAFEYAKKKWYTVEITLKAMEDDTVCAVVIKDRESGEVLYSKQEVPLNAKVNVDIDGMGYGAYSKKNSEETKVYIDNISVEKVDLVATLATTREAAINGKGNIAIKFNSEYVDESINDTNIKVYCGETLVEGYKVSKLSQNRVKIDLPVLEPATVYTVRVDGVVGKNGIVSVCEVPFKTVPCSSVSNAAISGTDVTFKLKNNSAESEYAYIMAVCENDEDMLENVYYKKFVMTSGDNECSFEDIVSDTTKSVYLYVVNDLFGGVNPLSDFEKINN